MSEELKLQLITALKHRNQLRPPQLPNLLLHVRQWHVLPLLLPNLQ